ncbi:MAG: hypothetical protein AB7P42_11315, partial [Gammaproteobacteria bacterium]
MGRQPGAAAAITRLRALLDEVTANANPRDAAALGALRDRARAALAETAALTAGVPAVKTEHDALQAALPALERRIAVASGQGPQIGRHRPAPPPAAPAVADDADPLRAPQDQANAYGEAPASGYGRVQPVADPPPVDSYVVPDTDGPRAQGYGQVDALRGAQQTDMYTLDDDNTGHYLLDDDEDAPAQPDAPAVQIPPPPPQPPADGFARRAAQHAERRAAL